LSATSPPELPPSEAESASPSAARERLLKLLDRETAVAQATDGRLAVLILELRRVDRLHALLRGPSPGTTMALVLERLEKALRADDRLAPINDDQVCIVLPRLSHPSQAVLAAVKLLRALDRPITHEGGSAVLRPCIGVATLPEHGLAPGELLAAADISCRIAQTREEGYHVYAADDEVETELYRGLDRELERAIRANDLELHFQPQVELASSRPVAVEALLRWNHPAAGEIDARTIVGIAERTGLLGTLTFWVLNGALRQAATWHSEGLAAPRLAVNLSVSSLTDRELPEVLDQALRTWGVSAHSLVLEIPESAMIADAERSVAILTRLKAVGLQIAIDGFGSGFTSLSSLKRFPIDYLKIDRPFVAGMLNDPGDRALVRSAIDIGHHFGLQVAAEGIERAEIRDALATLGCDLGQGTAIASPMSAEALRDWWATRGPER
jgi:EAL domain-containing protein (putative c-di-GMP-specific phosphodiesterase class I)/GGDEF domain-containing protein